ncbi:MAG TPA: hypothetical protein DDY78_01745 [Planctomycetales bacterium]|jgi:hypothetical protein|nr:hypothetical protein [Planctomycetales bacterium]
MAAGQSGSSHGIPNDQPARDKIRAGLNDDEKQEFDGLIQKVDGGGKPTKKQAQFIRRLKAQGKIPTPSRSFRNPSDRKTHQDS